VQKLLPWQQPAVMLEHLVSIGRVWVGSCVSSAVP
jgi:hypothetical protein